MAKAYDRDGGSGGHGNLRDIYLRHSINLTRYSTHEARKLQGILDIANTQIRNMISKAKSVETKEKYRRIASEIRQISNELSKQLNEKLEKDFKELAEEETHFVKKAVETAFENSPVKVDFELPAPKKIWAAASFKPYDNKTYETYDSYYKKMGDDVYKVWDMNVRAGYLAGLTAQQINRAVLGSVKDNIPGDMQKFRKSLERNTRTMVASLAETARDATYKANSSLFSGYHYVGTLDSRTCPVCGELDGQKFGTLEDAPQLPAHHNCRCLYIPIIKGMEEDFDADDERASADGPVSANLTYSDWLKTQSDNIQKDILGATRFNLYKSGMPINSFVADGRVLTLPELMKKEGITSMSMPGSPDSNNLATIINRGTVDYSNMSHNAAIHEEAKWLNSHSAETGHEFGSVMSSDRKLLRTWEGTANRLDIDAKEFKSAIKGVAPKGANFIHSHLDGTLFSDTDMNTMCRIKEIDKLMVSLPNNDVYYMSVSNGDRPNKNLLRTTWDYLYFRNEHDEKIRLNTNKLLPIQKAEVIMKVTEKMADMFKWEWGKI
jgi:SPP1 gp7 family putative phage head morphogenesis protein